jgi:hypothetical protein
VKDGIDNQFVEIVIRSYQYPNTNYGTDDRNWLNIYIKVKSNFGHWQTIDPSLLTWEVQTLIQWFKCLEQSKKPRSIEMEFIEPNIAFYLLNDYCEEIKKIKITFSLESRPKIANADIEYFMIFNADSSELSRISTDLEKELEKFPVIN